MKSFTGVCFRIHQQLFVFFIEFVTFAVELSIEFAGTLAVKLSTFALEFTRDLITTNHQHLAQQNHYAKQLKGLLTLFPLSARSCMLDKRFLLIDMMAGVRTLQAM